MWSTMRRAGERRIEMATALAFAFDAGGLECTNLEKFSNY